MLRINTDIMTGINYIQELKLRMHNAMEILYPLVVVNDQIHWDHVSTQFLINQFSETSVLKFSINIM